MVSRKLPMETLQKLHVSNRLYIEQVTSHLMLLLSAKACSETAKRNSVCLEIPFNRNSCLTETSQFICVANQLTSFFVMREVWEFRLISGWGVFRWVHGFCRFLGELSVNLRRLCVFDGSFLKGGLNWVLYFAWRNF